ncbi:hypothetical protein OAO87_03010 [bacterium]|nr:hypothetical protein [bacterium]
MGAVGASAEGWRAAGCSPSCLIVLAQLKSVKYYLVMGLPHPTGAHGASTQQTVSMAEAAESAHAAWRARAAGHPITPETGRTAQASGRPRGCAARSVRG